MDWYHPGRRAEEEHAEAHEALVEELERHPFQAQFLKQIVRFIGTAWQETQNRNRYEAAQGMLEIAEKLIACGTLAGRPKK